MRVETKLEVFSTISNDYESMNKNVKQHKFLILYCKTVMEVCPWGEGNFRKMFVSLEIVDNTLPTVPPPVQIRLPPSMKSTG
jgi:hypothetical protein